MTGNRVARVIRLVTQICHQGVALWSHGKIVWIAGSSPTCPEKHSSHPHDKQISNKNSRHTNTNTNTNTMKRKHSPMTTIEGSLTRSGTGGELATGVSQDAWEREACHGAQHVHAQASATSLESRFVRFQLDPVYYCTIHRFFLLQLVWSCQLRHARLHVWDLERRRVAACATKQVY